MSDKRKHARLVSLQSGRILFDAESSPVKCAILNVSDGGACLLVASTVCIPQKFELAIESSFKHRSCSVAWRTATRLGVKFGDVQLVE
jgi:hypothetical protein